MKKLLYVILFGFLGLIVATIIHGVVELVALDLIFGNPTNAESVWWTQWELIHLVAGSALWVVGLLLGLYAGFHWWGQYGSKPGGFGWGSQK